MKTTRGDVGSRMCATIHLPFQYPTPPSIHSHSTLSGPVLTHGDVPPMGDFPNNSPNQKYPVATFAHPIELATRTVHHDVASVELSCSPCAGLCPIQSYTAVPVANVYHYNSMSTSTAVIWCSCLFVHLLIALLVVLWLPGPRPWRSGACQYYKNKRPSSARVLDQQRKQEKLNEESAPDSPSGSSDIVGRMRTIEQILLDAKQDRQEIKSQSIRPSSRRSRLRGGSSGRPIDFDDQVDPDQNRTIPRDSLGQRDEATNEGTNEGLSQNEAAEVLANHPSHMPYVIPRRRASSDTGESSIAMTSANNVGRMLSPDEFADGIGRGQPPRHPRYSGRGQRAVGRQSRRAASSSATSQVEVRHQVTRQPRPPPVNLHATAFQQPRSGRSRKRPSIATPKPFEVLETLTEDEERDRWQANLRAQIQDEVNRSTDTTGDRTSDVEKTSASSQSTSSRTQDLRDGAGPRLFMPSFSSEEDDGSDPCSPAECEGSIIVCPAVSDTTRTRLAKEQLLSMVRHSEYSQWLYDRATRVVPSSNADYQSYPTSQRFYHHHYFHTTTADSAASRPQPRFGPDVQNNLSTTSHASPGSDTSGHDLFKSPIYSTSQRQSRSSASSKSTRYRNKLNFDVFEDALVPAVYDELGQLAPDEREPLQSLGRNATAGRLASNEAAIFDQQGRQAQRYHGSEEDGAEISPRTTLASQTLVAEPVPAIPSPAHDIHIWTSLIPEPGSSTRRQDPHITSDEEDSGDEDAASSTDPLPFGLFSRGRRHQCPKCYLWHEIGPSSSMPMVGTSPQEYSRMCMCPECRNVHRQRKNADTEAMDDATLFTTDKSKNVLDRQADLVAARDNSPPPDSVLSSPAFDWVSNGGRQAVNVLTTSKQGEQFVLTMNADGTGNARRCFTDTHRAPRTSTVHRENASTHSRQEAGRCADRSYDSVPRPPAAVGSPSKPPRLHQAEVADDVDEDYGDDGAAAEIEEARAEEEVAKWRRLNRIL